MGFLCKLFGHKFMRYITTDNHSDHGSRKEEDVCSRCGHRFLITDLQWGIVTAKDVDSRFVTVVMKKYRDMWE